MTEEDLKLLAEWLGQTGINIFSNEVWYPHEDSNQLDMLMQKFIKEAKIARIEYLQRVDGSWYAMYNCDDLETDYNSEGKNMNECDLTVILNYIRSLKLQKKYLENF